MTTMTPAEHAGMPDTPIDPETLRHVRGTVKDILMASPAYRALPQEVKTEVARDMVRVGAYIVDGEKAGKGARAAALADQNQPPPPDTAGSDFARGGGAVAAQGGVAALADEVNKINFPAFVASLIHGTFDAIVTASIKQM